MKNGFFKESWKQLAPEVYHWSTQVTLDTVTDVQSGAIHVVVLAEAKPADMKDDAVTKDSQKDNDKIEFNAPNLSSTVTTALHGALEKIQYKGASTVVVEAMGSVFLVVPPTKIKTSKPQKSRSVGITAASVLKSMKKFNHAVVVKAEGICSKSVIDGLSQGFYSCQSFKQTKKEPSPSICPPRISLLGGTISPEEETHLRALMKSVALTRFIQDAPANWFDPVRFAEVAEEVCKDHGIKVEIHDKSSLEKLGMGSFLSVNAGSFVEPRMIVMEIEGTDSSKPVALIGKGLTFDAGGVSIKPSAGMEEMKYDMSGGAAVLGAALMLSQVKPTHKTVCIIGATENLVASKATKPGDVVVAMNGKTIEVQNTDAEGRLVLADLCHYANLNYKPELMIDIATLTGAVLVALGTVGAGLMSNDEGTAARILKASKDIGEPFWELPLWADLEGELKGQTADLNNIAKPSTKAGTIIGAMFIKEFVGKTKWAHLDIAGTGWNCRASGFPTSGGSAYGLRTMVETVLQFKA
jgi:leucyl aminopeptidase